MGYKSGQCYCISLYIYFEYHWVGFIQNHSPSSKSAKRIRLTAKEENSEQLFYIGDVGLLTDGGERSSDVRKPSERFFSPATTRPRTSALRGVSVVVGKRNPLSPGLMNSLTTSSSLASTLLL